MSLAEFWVSTGGTPWCLLVNKAHYAAHISTCSAHWTLVPNRHILSNITPFLTLPGPGQALLMRNRCATAQIPAFLFSLLPESTANQRRIPSLSPALRLTTPAAGTAVKELRSKSTPCRHRW